MKKLSICIPALILAVMILLTGCSGAKMEASIIIDGEATVCEIKSKDTVGEILEKNGITIGEKDVVEPAAEETFAEAEKAEINIYRNKTVTVKADGETKKIEIAKGTVADALEKAGVKVGKKDALNYAEDVALTADMEIKVLRAVKITLTHKGETKDYTTTQSTVKKALEKLGIDFDKDDIVEPSLDSKIKAGMNITLQTVEFKEEVEEEVIYYSSLSEYSSSMDEGTSEVTQSGSDGSKKVTYYNKYIDGELVDSEVKDEKIITEAVDEIVVYGTRPIATAAPQTTTAAQSSDGRQVVSKERVEDCDGSGHGYYVITYSDGTVEYEDF